MKRKSVGYFEGTNPEVLTSLVCEGYDTIPISNGLDNHGRHIRLLNEETKVDVLIGYLHKIYAPENAETQAEDIFHICEIYRIPFLIIVPCGLHCNARDKFASIPDVIQFVDPSTVLEKTITILQETDEAS